MEDERFKRISTDAKFRRVPGKQQKVQIDNRFQSMFKDKKFKEEYIVDERGRPVHHSSAKDLKRLYYQTSSDESSSETDEETNSKTESVDGVSKKDLKKGHDAGEKISVDVKKKLKNLKVDYARGEQKLFSESSSDDDESEDENEEENEIIEHKWGELDAEAGITEEATNRLAVCNMDWDRIRAVDIMVLLNSFLPPAGIIESVKIYISEFGKKRLAEEDISGPPELRQEKFNEDDETEEGSKYHMEKLRQYQLNRLKYYYAVATFNSVDVANKVYIECDGVEYESSATKMDLRFIPDDMTFEDEPKEVCDKLPEMKNYQPRFFITTALQQAKVNLTWDETNPDRIEITEKINNGKLEDIDKTELQNFLALTDEDSDEEDDGENSDVGKDENPIEKYKALLEEIEVKEKEKENKDIQMEVTWGLQHEKKSQELVKKKLAEKEEKTPFQQYLDKRKEKKKERKKMKKQASEKDSDDSDSDIPSDIDMDDPYFAEEFNNSQFEKKKSKKTRHKETVKDEQNEEKQAELELLLMNDNEDSRKHFSLKKIQENLDLSKKAKKKKKKDTKELTEDNFEVDVTDARFSAVFSSHHYNIDPSDPHYKKTTGMEKLISEKLKRRADNETPVAPKISKMDNSNKHAELSVLIKSVKRKTQAINKK
ncbi:hypothetical protein HHI36_011428 [Cryptolaemus montrouzieri]|uniref:NUC153 domain-containing protein n=1 Tax=Cryptolaemus montrouzieri TaxID=559131 RepID=A0ABD2MLZ1_9CUCU